MIGAFLFAHFVVYVDDRRVQEWADAGVDGFCRKAHLKDLPLAVKALMDGI